jgi:hypothetical protein
MKQGTIISVSRIERNSAKETINVVVIALSNGTTIVRQLNQFKVDLSNSGRLLGYNLDSINSVNHPAIAKECVALKNGGTVVGNYYGVKAGDEYEDTNPSSPTFGKMKQYTTDFIRVDGFLDLSPNAKYAQMEMNADASANLTAQLQGLFDTLGASASSSTKETASEDELSPELMAELSAGAAAPVADEPETVTTKK